jgi:ferrous-iron efflux pump FieF
MGMISQEAQDSVVHRSRKVPTVMLTVGVVGVMVVLKSFAYIQSGSVSILTSLTDSVLDIIVSVMALASVLYAQKPADEDHRWGHGKMEAVSALLQSTIIIGGATFLLFESVNRMLAPKPIHDHWMSIAVMGISTLLSIVLVVWQRRTLRNERSLSIEAENVNYSSDVLINIGTILVLLWSVYGAPLWADALFTILVAFFMAAMASRVLRRAMNMLLDREIPLAERNAIIQRLEAHEEVLGWHDLRTRINGDCYDISFDIEVYGHLSLLAAHKITKDLELDLVGMFSKCDVMIHVDPQGFTEDSRHRVKGIHI